MTKNNGNFLIFFFALVFLLTGYTVSGSENDTITKKETFKSSYESETKKYEDSIFENNAEYKLQNVSYKVIDKKAVKEKKKKTITLTSDEVAENDTYTPKKKVKEGNITYKLKSTEKVEKSKSEEKRRKVTGYIDYDSKSAAQSAPDIHTFTANGATADCKKQGMKKLKANSWESSYINLTFMSYDKDYYEWNGVQIDGDAKEPLKGHEAELLKSIGADTDNYRVKKTYWSGKAYQKDGIYYRKAKADIQKKIPHYRVHYEGYSKPKSKKTYVYKSTYEATVKEDTGEYLYTIEAIALYKRIIPETTTAHQEVTRKETPRIIRVGIFLFSIIFIGVLYIVYFKSGKEKESKHLR